MSVWVVRDRKYLNVLEICSTKELAIQYIEEHHRETEWFYQEKKVRCE